MSEFWAAREFRLDLSKRNLLMGVLNVTPDSFSDGGQFFDPEKAVERGLRMAEEGADIIDVGGVSTRPGASVVGVEEQIRRIESVIGALARNLKVPVSADTTDADVASAALDAGASILNDISGLANDPGIARLAAASGAGLVIMHMRGTPATMQSFTHYDDLFGEIFDFLLAGIRKASEAGVRPEQIVIDTGIGFSKTAEQNMEILAALEFL